MRPEVAAHLLALNQSFYTQLADSFAQSREQPQPGFARLLSFLPATAENLLDVGCGNGRFGHFWRQHNPHAAYTAVDFSPLLLEKARGLVPEGAFWQRDMSQPGFLADLGTFEVIVCLAAMQHIPGQANRVRLLQEMGAHLAGNGRLCLSNWQFLDNPRQQRKLRPWAEAGLQPEDVEPGDCLLTWQREGFGLRYVCQIDADQTNTLVNRAGLHVVAQFRSDGREGDLNLYTLLAPVAPIPANVTM